VSAAARLARELRREDDLLASAVLEPAPGVSGGPAARAAAGPRTRDRADEYELLVEAIYEGYLLHYGCSRLLRCEDSDLALLAGDRLYALGITRLVALGDVDAVSELADVIALCALAHASEDIGLADAVWEAGARAVGWGSSPEYRAAKEAARTGAPGAADALRTAARGPETARRR
jgi:hypothetical protein